jgi:hypothetical protein
MNGKPPVFVPQMAANPLVVGFIVGVGLAWPVQEIFGWAKHTNWADCVSLGIGFVIAIIMFDWMLGKNKKRHLGIADRLATLVSILRSRLSNLRTWKSRGDASRDLESGDTVGSEAIGHQ